MGPTRACKRRIDEFLPGGKPTTAFERDLWTVAKHLELGFEVQLREKPDQERLLREAREALERVRRDHPEPPPEVKVAKEEYRLVLDSLDHYLARVDQAFRAQDPGEAKVQAVGLQHILGEFWENNPGVISPLNALPYAVQYLAHIPAPSPASRDAWRNRIALARLRIGKWLATTDDPRLPRLDAIQGLRSQLDTLEALVQVLSEADQEAPEAVRGWLSKRFRKSMEEAEEAVYRLTAHANVVRFQPGFLPRYLPKDDPEYDPRAF